MDQIATDPQISALLTDLLTLIATIVVAIIGLAVRRWTKADDEDRARARLDEMMGRALAVKYDDDPPNRAKTTPEIVRDALTYIEATSPDTYKRFAGSNTGPLVKRIHAEVSKYRAEQDAMLAREGKGKQR